VLLFANGVGGVVGGLLLEMTGRIPTSVRSAVIATFLLGLSTLGFAVTGSYVLGVVLLVIGGVASLAAMSIGQTIVQLAAPPDKRGRIIGLYNMSANGLRFGSGITVGFLGGLIGVHWSLGVSAAALSLCALAIGLYTRGFRSHRSSSVVRA
jgi:MFS family permease